jgi:hypothetical protein
LSIRKYKYKTFYIYIYIYIADSGDYFRFGSVFIKKKVIKLVFLKKKTEIGSNRPVSVWLVILEQKTVQPGFFGLTRFFPVCLGFFGLASFFPVWLDFFQFGFDSVFLVLGL